MKHVLRRGLALVLAGVIVTGFSGCNIFATMRENAERAAKIEIKETPGDVAAVFSNAVEISPGKAAGLTETVSYGVGRPEVLTADGEKAGILNAAADQLAKLIMNADPGGSETPLDPAAPGDTLLQPLSGDDISLVEMRRNEYNERVTDEKGRETSDEEGNAVTEVKIRDNLLTLTMIFVGKDEDGEDYTAVPRAEDEVISRLFGGEAEKAHILSVFEAAKDCLPVSDYAVGYAACRIVCEINLDTGVADYITYEKHMNVTADAAGAGILADYGDLEVRFPLTKTVKYTFMYQD